MRQVLILLTAVVVTGCGGSSGPSTTDMSSDAFSSLEQRVEFLQRYVTFRRGYTDLGFHITYHNNGGGVPGPSEWDIRLVATVPPAELSSWVPFDLAPKTLADTEWLVGVPRQDQAIGIKEWYAGAGLIVGIDRERSVVAYRRWNR
jgi:hypothetical protein